MTTYLLDENVLRELHERGHAAVREWYASVTDADLRISVVTLFEKRRGWERRMKSDPTLATAMLARLDALESAYGQRLVPIDGPIVREWARSLGAKDKNMLDLALAATARVHGFVLVTRNIGDFTGYGVRVLNPFRKPAAIVTV